MNKKVCLDNFMHSYAVYEWMNWLGLSSHEVNVLAVINSFSDNKKNDGTYFISVDDLANMTSCSERTVQRSLQKLVSLGIVNRECTDVIHPQYKINEEMRSQIFSTIEKLRQKGIKKVDIREVSTYFSSFSFEEKVSVREGSSVKKGGVQ